MQIKAAGRSETRRRRCCRIAGRVLEPEFFRALCEPTRIGVLVRLAERGRPSTVSEIAGCCDVDLSVVSRHLAVLRGTGIVQATRRGREVFHEVRYAAMSTVLRRMADAIDDCCPTRSESPSTKENPHVQ